jgi:TolB protein
MRLRALFSIASALAMVLAAQAAPRAARADIVVDVNQGAIQPLPIAITPFKGDHGAEIAQVVSADLERSGYFKIVDPAAFVEKDLDVNVQPKFESWTVIGAQALLDGADATDTDGRLRSNFRLWDVNGSGKELLGLQYTATPENWRRVAHKIADAVFEKLTGQKGYFDTRVVFVAESGPRGHRVKRLAIMDQDGANPQYLTGGASQVLTPHYSASGQEVTYMTLSDNQTNIYLFNLDTGRQESLGHFSGLVFSPRFSPDGTKVAFSMTKNGNTDIWLMDLRTRAQTRLTSDPAIDTSPSFSPDGRQIVFNSDRSGTPELYIMNLDGSSVRRISQGGGRYNTPVWSPVGDLIAFTKQEGGGFSIGVMNTDGSGEHILSTSYFEEGPTWAPNGRYLLFHRQAMGGEPRLWMVDVTGRVSRPAPYNLPASDPAWSPMLQ